jgi:hypothetical protein
MTAKGKNKNKDDKDNDQSDGGGIATIMRKRASFGLCILGGISFRWKVERGSRTRIDNQR